MDHFPQFLILKDFYHKTLIHSIHVYERNCSFFSHGEFKNYFRDIPWDNILSLDGISGSLSFGLFVARVNTLLDEHEPYDKLSKKENIAES